MLLVFDADVVDLSSRLSTVSVPGLLASDSVIAVSQIVPGSNQACLVSFEDTHEDGSIACLWNGNPGAGAMIRIVITRA